MIRLRVDELLQEKNMTKYALYKQLGMRLRKLRENKGLSQTDAGKRIGVSRSTMNGYESNM